MCCNNQSFLGGIGTFSCCGNRCGCGCCCGCNNGVTVRFPNNCCCGCNGTSGQNNGCKHCCCNHCGCNGTSGQSNGCGGQRERDNCERRERSDSCECRERRCD